MTRSRKASKRSGLVEWAKSTPLNTGGRKCLVCKHEAIAAEIRALMEYRRAGNPTPSVTQVWRELEKRYPGVGLTAQNIYRHIASHEGGWGGRG